MGSQVAPAVAMASSRVAVAGGGEDVARAQVGDLLGEAGGVPAGGQGRDLEELGELADDVDGLASDGAGGAEDGDSLWRHGSIVARTRARVCDPGGGAFP